MDLVDRIERRRFVGREFLLWLWFETEIFEATVSTREQGSFGMWVEGRLVLGEGQEVTSIKGTTPGNHREAKESLRRGKLPVSAGFHLSWADHDARFALKGETLAIAGLVLPTALDKGEDEPALAPAPAPTRRKMGGRGGARPREDERDSDEATTDAMAEAFYERMHLTREIEAIVVALYRQFLTLRLAPVWNEAVVPALNDWIGGNDVDVDAYAEARASSVGKKRKRASLDR